MVVARSPCPCGLADDQSDEDHMQEGVTPATITATVSDDGTLATVAVLGEVDIANSGDLMRELSLHIQDGRETVVDLADTTFLDASVVSALVSAYKLSSSRGVKMSIVNAHHRAVVRVLVVSGADRILPMEI